MKNNWNELKDIKAPQELKERTLAAAREARKLTDEPLHAVPRHPWGMAKRLLAAACAFGIVLGGTAVYRTHNGTAQTGSAAVADAINHTFGFAAYAADTGELRQPKDSKIVFDTGGAADDPEKGFYSGCLFKVTGEDIKTVSATIDKGAVYRTKTVKDTSDDRDEWVRSMHQGTTPNSTVQTGSWSGAVTRCICTPTCAGSWTTASPTRTTRTPATVCGCPASR